MLIVFYFRILSLVFPSVQTVSTATATATATAPTAPTTASATTPTTPVYAPAYDYATVLHIQTNFQTHLAFSATLLLVTRLTFHMLK